MFLGNQLLKVFFDDALSVRALLCWTKFGEKNLASDFHEPRAHLQVATVWVGVYVTTFCYLSLCEPMSA